MTRAQLTDQEREFVGPYLPVGMYGPYPERLRQQFEGVIWRFKTGGLWRDAGVLEALLEGMIAETAHRGEVDMSLVSVDSTIARAHRDAAGIHLDEDVLTTLEKAAAEEEKARQKGGEAEGQDGRSVESDPVREERRRIRRRRKLRLKVALLGRSRGGQTSKVQQGSSRRRPQVPPAGARADRRAGRRQPTVHPRAGQGPRPLTGRPSPHPAGRGRRRQGVLVPRQPRLPA